MEDVILQGVSEVATDVCNNIIQSLSFDRTIIGEIAEVDKDNDRYLISYDGLKFYVNCTDNYTKGTSVYVLIPDGDFSNDKVILSKHTNKQTTPIEVDKGFGNKVECPIEREDSMFYLPYISTFAPPKYLGVKFSLNRTDVEVPQDKNFTVSISFGTKGEEKQWEINSSSLLGNFDNIVENFYFYCVSEEQTFQIEEYTANISLYFGKDKSGTKQWLKLVSVEYFILADQPTLGTVGVSTVTNPISFASGRTNLFLEYMSADGTFYTYQNSKEDVNIKYYRYAPSADSAYKEIEPDELWNAEVDVDPDYSFETYKIELIDNEETYGGMTLIYNSDVSSKTAASTVTDNGIILTCSDAGIYNYYSSTGKVIDNTYLTEDRTIVVQTTDGLPLDNAIITWHVPTENTMIKQQNSEDPAYFIYHLNSTYITGIKDNNTITCEVKFPNGEIRTCAITLRFGQWSTGGTEYAFNLDFVGNTTYLLWDGSNEVEVEAKLERLDDGAVPADYEVVWSWVGKSDGVEITTNVDKATLRSTGKGSISTNFRNLVLKASTIITWDEDNTTTLNAYLPIPFSNVENRRLSGTTYITYGTDNTVIESASRTPYKIYEIGSRDAIKIASITIESDLAQAPSIGNNTLSPYAIYPDSNPIFTVLIKTEDGYYWQQPVFSIFNKYENDVINKWNGKTSVGEEGVLTPFLAVGDKNGENAFSGVVAGSWANGSGDTLEKGLYGFDGDADNPLRFFLTNKGSFFVGNPATGFMGYNLPKEQFGSYFDDQFSLDDSLVLSGRYWQSLITDSSKSYITLDGFQNNILSDIRGTGVYIKNLSQSSVQQLILTSGFLTDEKKNEIVPMSLLMNLSNDFWSNLKIEARCFKDREYARYANLILMASKRNKGDTTSLSDATENMFVHPGNGISMILRSQGYIDIYSNNIEATFLNGSVLFEYDDHYVLTAKKYSGKGWGFVMPTGGPYKNENVYVSSENDTDDASQIVFRNGIVKMANRVFSTVRAITSDKTKTGNGINVDADLNIFCGGYTFATSTRLSGALYINKNGGQIVGNWQYVVAEKSNGTLDGSWSAVNGTTYNIATKEIGSDSRIKHSIKNYSEAYEKFFNLLNPVTFIYSPTTRYGTSQRRHCGFIANEIENSLSVVGLTAKDFAGFAILDYSEDEDNTEKIRALQYDEFISLNTWQIQKLKARVDELEKELKELKQL